MKRKLFSAILFGALLTASTSGLTSCKDYDDDISNLQSQIDKLATADQLSAKVSELQAAISAAQSAAESKAAAAQTVADAAKAAAADAAAAASKAQGAADDAAKAAAAAAEVGKAAQAAVDKLAAEAATKADLEAAAQAAQAAVEAIKAEHATDKAKIEAAIETGLDAVKAEIAATNEKLAGLATRLDTVEAKLAALEAGEGQEEVLAAIQAEVEDIADVLESLGISVSEMITAIHLYNNFGFDNDLKFFQVKEAVDRTFPYGDEVENVTNETVEFKSGTVRALEDSILVRVSPASAVLHAEDLSLINTQGKELDASLFESIEVKEFNREAPMTTTRAEGNNNTGLWVVKFKLVKDFDADKFAAETAIKDNGQILFALAAANCDINLSEDRRVATEFDVTVAAPKAKHAMKFDLQPATAKAPTHVAEVHHRFTAYTNPLAGTFPASLKGDDWKWASDLNTGDAFKAGKANLVFDKEATGDAQNAVKEDSRQDKKVLAVSEGEKIAIKFDEPIKAFYVTVDWKRAGESGNSEINAWNTYSYTNVGKVDKDGKVIEAAPVQYGQEGFISVDELKQYASQGDVIGFRVWAINLDGSMVDPDGTAFYVGIGQNADISEKTVSGSAVVTVANSGNNWKKNSVTMDVEDAFGIDFNSISFVQNTNNMDGNAAKEDVEGYKPTVADSMAVVGGAKPDIVLSYLDKDGKILNPTNNFTKVKYLRARIVNAANLVDGKAYNIKATLKATVGGTTAIVRYVNINLTKEMPTTFPAELTVGRSDLQEEEVLVSEGEWNSGYTAVVNADNKVNVDDLDNGYYNEFAEWVDDNGVKNIKPIWGAKAWYLVNGNQGFGRVNLADAYYLPNGVTSKLLTSQSELVFSVAGARRFDAAEGDKADKNKKKWPGNYVVNPAGVANSSDRYMMNNIAGQFVNGASRNVTAKYVYTGISHSFRTPAGATTKSWDRTYSGTTPTWSNPSGENVEKTQALDPIKFMSWSTNNERYTTWKWAKKCIETGTSKAANQFADANEIGFNGGTLSLDEVQATYGIKLTTKAAADPTNWGWISNTDYTKGSLSTLLTNDYLKLASIKLTYAGAASTTFSVTEASGTVTFTVLNPTTVAHTEYLELDLVDCFSQHIKLSLPVEVVATPKPLKNINTSAPGANGLIMKNNSGTTGSGSYGLIK